MPYLNRVRLTAAVTVCAVGFLTIPAVAYGRPPIPRAPVCGKWVIPAGSFVINQDNNIVVEMDGWGGESPSEQHIQYKLNFSLFGQPPEVTQGTVTEGAVEGDSIHFKADWDPRPGSSDWNEYSGKIDGDGYAHGTTHNDGQDSAQGEVNGWHSAGPLLCVPSPGVPWMPNIVTSS